MIDSELRDAITQTIAIGSINQVVHIVRMCEQAAVQRFINSIEWPEKSREFKDSAWNALNVCRNNTIDECQAAVAKASI